MYIGKRSDTQNVSDIEKWYADASQGVIGGCDLDCGSTYAHFLPGAVRSKHAWINRTTIDQSVNRVVKHTIMLGLMDDGAGGSSPYESYGADQLDTPAHRQLAQDAATQSIVLLRNGNASTIYGSDQTAAIGSSGGAGTRLLPLSNTTKLFIGGPNANSAQESFAPLVHVEVDPRLGEIRFEVWRGSGFCVSPWLFRCHMQGCVRSASAVCLPDTVAGCYRCSDVSCEMGAHRAQGFMPTLQAILFGRTSPYVTSRNQEFSCWNASGSTTCAYKVKHNFLPVLLTQCSGGWSGGNRCRWS